MRFDAANLGRLATDRSLWADFIALCDCGGRLAGTESERRALAFLEARGEEATGRPAQRLPVPYGGWSCRDCSLLMLGDGGFEVPCHPLVRTVSTPPDGLAAEVVDLGRGTAEEFAAQADEIGGRVVLVRHEYMFAAGHLHRRRKYQWAREYGAQGFLIASPLPGCGPVAGSSGREGPDGIPAAGIGYEAAARLASGAGPAPRVRLRIDTVEAPSTTETLVFDMPGRTDELVVLSAHLDGHDLAESAIDNASGVAVALAVARALAPVAARFRRGLRLCLFSVEEWALTGSRHYVDGLPQQERERIVLNVNLDSVGGSSRLAALTSGFAGLAGFLRGAAAACGRDLRIYRPMMRNSDHANFAEAGIPAVRLVAGFDDPGSNLRFVLTPADTRDKVAPAELLSAALLALTIVSMACEAPEETIRSLY
jgi:hypothetical protein